MVVKCLQTIQETPQKINMKLHEVYTSTYYQDIVDRAPSRYIPSCFPCRGMSNM